MLLHKILNMCEEKDLTIAEIERSAGLSSRTMYSWDESMPAADKLARVAKVLGTTVEELLKE